MHEDLDLQRGQDADGKVDGSSMVQVDSKDNGRRSEPFEIETDHDDENDIDDDHYKDGDDASDGEGMEPLIRNQDVDPPAGSGRVMSSSSLSPSSHQNRRSLRGMYLAKQLAAGYDDDDKSCWTRIRGSLAQLAAISLFLLVASVIFAPSDVPMDSGENIDDRCKTLFNMSVSELMQSIEAATARSNTMNEKNLTSSPGVDAPDAAFCVDNATLAKYKLSCRCPSPIRPTPHIF